jgi:eukaryotic-like serine/threonine-protein kinase
VQLGSILQSSPSSFEVKRAYLGKLLRERGLGVQVSGVAWLSGGAALVLDSAGCDGLEMPQIPSQPLGVRFGAYEVNFSARELRKHGIRVRLPGQPFDILTILLEHSGEVVTREELRRHLWPGDTFVDFEHGVNNGVKKLRAVLGDSADHPLYIETLARVGYRFIAPLEQAARASSRARGQLGMRRRELVAAVIVVVALSAASYFYFRRTPKLTDKDTIVLADFLNTTGDPVFDGTLRQGMAVQLEQSPFLSIVSEQQIQQIVRMMSQPAEAKLTPEIAREVCQRTGGAAVLEGSIAQIGTQYLLTLTAVNCVSGETLASTESQASDKNHVLDALGKTAADIRNKLGESLSTVQRFDTPLEQATTPSLEALRAFSSGHKVQFATGSAAAIPFFKRAVELDPNFALAHAWLGRVYGDIGEFGTSADYTRRAYELRDRASEREKYLISAHFHIAVTGNLEMAEQSCKLCIQAYPRAHMPHDFLAGIIFQFEGQYEKAVEEGREAVRLEPDDPIAYATLLFNYIALNRIDEAKSTYANAMRHTLNQAFYCPALYEIAFLQNDAAGMAEQVVWSAGKPGVEDGLLALEADTAGYSGRLGEAREFSRRAVDAAERAQEEEAAATYSAVAALREALFGNTDEAKRRAILAMNRSPGRDVRYGAALAFAYAGDVARAQALTEDLSKRFPEDTIVQFNFLPTLRAKLAVQRGNTSEAIENLRAAAPYELGASASATYAWNALYPAFVRGEARLAAHQGKEAAAEFQKILDHRGVVLYEPIGALARLGLARAWALEGDTGRARAAYRDFLTAWKDADPDIPILKQAEAEYAELQ